MLVLAGLMTSALLSGQSGPTTAGHVNGRFWRVSPKAGKQTYAFGLFDGLEIGNRRTELPTGFFRSYISDLDRFYAIDKNLNIPIYMATEYLLRKQKGEITKEMEPFQIEAMRQISTELDSESRHSK